MNKTQLLESKLPGWVAALAALSLLAGCAPVDGNDTEGEEAVGEAVQYDKGSNGLPVAALSSSMLSNVALAGGALSSSALSSSALSAALNPRFASRSGRLRHVRPSACCNRQRAISAWLPESNTAGTVMPSYSSGRV